MSTPNDPAGALAKAVREWLNDPQNRDPDAFEVWVKLKAYEEAAKAAVPKRDGDKFQIENLVVLVMRLCALLPPDKQARVAALDYLQRHKLTPSPLREQIEVAKAGPTKQVDWILELRDALRIYFHSRLEIDEERDPVLKIIAKHAQPNREVSARDSELLEFLERARHLLKSTQYAGGLSYVEIGRVIEAERARAAEGKP